MTAGICADMDLRTINAYARFEIDVQHAQERLRRELDQIVTLAECAAQMKLPESDPCSKLPD